MADVYPDAMETARKMMRMANLLANVHEAVADNSTKHGFSLGHLSGHSIGTTMIEYPAIGAKSEVQLEENMVFLCIRKLSIRTVRCVSTRKTLSASVAPKPKTLADMPWKFYSRGDARPSLRGSDRWTRMKESCIIGCGAVGSLFAAHLAQRR